MSTISLLKYKIRKLRKQHGHVAMSMFTQSEKLEIMQKIKEQREKLNEARKKDRHNRNEKAQ